MVYKKKHISTVPAARTAKIGAVTLLHSQSLQQSCGRYHRVLKTPKGPDSSEIPWK